MLRILGRSAACLLASLLLSASTCDGKSRFPSPFLTLVGQTEGSGAMGRVTATATCVRSATLIGGGFLVQPNNNYNGLVVRGNHPNTANGWTVEFENTTPTPGNGTSFVTTWAFCLQRADLAPRVTVQEADGTATLGSLGAKVTVSAVCPTGSVLISGGYEVDGPLSQDDVQYNAGVEGSSPTGSSIWEVDAGEFVHAAGTRRYHAFAVCASSPLKAGFLQKASVTPVAGASTNVDAPCPANTFTTGGGFLLNPGANGTGNASPYPEWSFESMPKAEFAQWTISAVSYSNSPLTSVVLCIPNL